MNWKEKLNANPKNWTKGQLFKAVKKTTGIRFYGFFSHIEDNNSGNKIWANFKSNYNNDFDKDVSYLSLDCYKLTKITEDQIEKGDFEVIG